MEEAKKFINEAIADSQATDYEKGNLSYLAEYYADKVKQNTAEEILSAMESNNDPWKNHIDIVKDFLAPSVKEATPPTKGKD